EQKNCRQKNISVPHISVIQYFSEMNERMDRLRRLSQPLEPSFDQNESWTKKVDARAQLYLESLTRDRDFWSSTTEGQGILGSLFSKSPKELDGILSLLEEQVMGSGIRLGAPGFLGFIPISSL